MDNVEYARKRWPSFAETVQRIREAGTDNLSHFGNGYVREGGYSLQQNPDEFAALLELLRYQVKGMGDEWPVYLEIGSASGGAARLIHEVADIKWMFSIDDGGHHRYPELQANFDAICLHDSRMKHFRADSHSGAASDWLTAMMEIHTRVDIAFIDGDHSYDGAWKDVELCAEHWGSGSLVIFHDIVACDGVKRVWERGTQERIWSPIAEYIGAERPLGIGVGFVL